MQKISHLRGLLALSPLLLFVLLYMVAGIVAGDFYKVPVAVAFMACSVYAVALPSKQKLSQRIRSYGRGAAQENIMLMIWIFVLAGAFAASAKAVGCTDATVNLTLRLLPGNMLLGGLFVASCFVSLSVGTSVGTIVALVPIAAGLAEQASVSLPLVTAIVVGGAFFGDNLSFISDTTIASTQTQGCQLSDKFRANVLIVAPAAIVVLLVYLWMGRHVSSPAEVPDASFVKVLPYIVVIVAAMGMNVMTVLVLGIILTGIIGLADGYGFYAWLGAMGDGINGMGELIIVTLMAGGLLEIIRENGGIDYIIDRLTSRIRGKRGAELAIAAIVTLTNVCTANNTVAIVTVGGIARRIAETYGVDARKSASLLDTFSCFAQGLLPYGAQLLMAGALASLAPTQIIPFLYYPPMLALAALLSIALRYPKKYS